MTWREGAWIYSWIDPRAAVNGKHLPSSHVKRSCFTELYIWAPDVENLWLFMNKCRIKHTNWPETVIVRVFNHFTLLLLEYSAWTKWCTPFNVDCWVEIGGWYLINDVCDLEYGNLSGVDMPTYLPVTNAEVHLGGQDGCIRLICRYLSITTVHIYFPKPPKWLLYFCFMQISCVML